MFLPSHLYTGSGSDQKVPAPTGSGSATLIILIFPARVKLFYLWQEPINISITGSANCTVWQKSVFYILRKVTAKAHREKIKTR